MLKVFIFSCIVFVLPILIEEKSYQRRQLYPVAFLYALVIFLSVGEFEGEGFVLGLQIACIAAAGKLLIGVGRQFVCSVWIDLGSPAYWRAVTIDVALSVAWTAILITNLDYGKE